MDGFSSVPDRTRLRGYRVNVEATHLQLIDQVRRAGTDRGINLVAYSGGVDSTLVAHVVHAAFPDNALAFIGVSHSMPMDQLELARDLARHIGIFLRELPTGEGELEGYVANAGASCYFCKSTLYRTMQDFSRALSLELRDQTGEVVLFNGTNADDLTDPTRLGLKAAREFRVESPLSGLTKAQVREVSRHAGLPNWSYAASPCLRSRLQYGVPATPENLHRVEAAERLIRRMCALRPEENLRVRHLAGDVACVEIDAGRLEAVRGLRAELEPALESLGYRAVELRPFRSGSLSFLAPELAV
jgi:uncharacterized protein (TIGR00268 family)